MSTLFADQPAFKTLQLVFVLATLVIALATAGWAQTAPDNFTNFPMIGLTRGQTLLINVLAYPPSPCYAQLGFQGSNGSAVGTTLNVSLSPGQAAVLAINGNSLTAVKNQRVEVLPTVVVNPNEPQSQCVASAEVFTTSSGVSNVLVPGAVGAPNPDPPFSMAGVTSVQTVRLNVVAFPPSPCIGTLSFVNSNGTQVGNALNVQLATGRQHFLICRALRW